MLSELTAGIASIKHASDLINLAIQSKITDEVRKNLIELQNSLLSLQTAMFSQHAQYEALLRDKENLEKRLVEMENWNAEAAKYELVEITAGVFAYAIKPEQKGLSPQHWLCANCYQNQQKSILQRHKHTIAGLVYLCPNCKTEFLDHSKRQSFVS